MSKGLTGRTTGKHEGSAGHAKLVLAKNHILQYYKEPLTTQELADIAGYNKDYFIEKFKSAFGMTPVQYLIHVRVDKAKELALYAGLNVSQIAERVGYSDVHTFGKMFKKKTGSSLSQFCASLLTNTDYKEEDKTLP